jgi:hypothetical protein
MSVDLVLYIVSLVCFLLAAAGVPVARPHLGWLGCAFLTLSLVI